MLFIPNGTYIAFFYEDGKATTRLLSKGDVCVVIEYRDMDVAVHNCSDYRSLIPHPKYGPCKTFVTAQRGTILG